MATALDAQFGIVDESTFGTPVTVTRFYEFVSESLKMDQARIESAALRSGARVTRSDRWALGKKTVGGDVTFELANKSFGLLFKHMFGGVATAQPDSGGAPTVYKHTFTPGAYPTSMTAQVGRTDTGGTTRAFTYHGCRVESWELGCSVDEIASLKVSLNGEDEDTSTALATVSYPASLSLLTFVNGTLTIGGSTASVMSASVAGQNGLATDRYFLGSTLRKQQLEMGMRTYSGTFEAEFESLTHYNRFVNGTEAEIVLNFQGGVISGAFNYEAKITANVRFDGETPNVTGPEIVGQTLPFKVVDNGTTSIKLEYTTTDVNP
ncbi:hypothetical protein C8D88_116144 [Lentzea atacamensis]|uniref:Phage tail protein n=1 Tax=Lentzea atacamensis TaxID=531938 RepID=A0A316HTX4_9PSEU|nr:phage tail tube protein [Lentzea atacamensis]PWK81732.1 hypothetical protein C8D88_116144 [Lentzea atacamensis]